ncbi:MAG: type II secretion system inner membrane protein GspF [Myxococcota bacterium]|jgi:general secretion pathway protein F|nr:type II secretion system inner membrane protein GspF [Myxococcota bacterium]
MPVFLYKGYATDGAVVKGTRDSENERSIKQSLRKEGIFVTELKEAQAKKEGAASRFNFQMPSFAERVSTQDLSAATRQLATLVGAGIPLVESIIALVDQTENPTLKTVWADVKQQVNEGIGLGDAMGAHPKVFSPLYINLVRAGETSGAMDIVLGRLADFTESQAQMRSKLMGALFYPIVMIIMALGVTALLFVVVIPKISKIFESQNVALPLPTQVLIFLSDFTKNYWFLAIFIMLALAYGFKRYIGSAKGRPQWDSFLLTAPIFGPLVRMVAVTRFTKTLATLLASGVPLLTAFDIVKNVVQNTRLTRVIETARDCVKEGESIAAPIKRSGEFPPIVSHMIAVGERSGQLEEMLGKIAEAYEVQVDARLRMLTSTLEPLLLVVLGVIVAFIVFSILLPMLEISSFA